MLQTNPLPNIKEIKKTFWISSDLHKLEINKEKPQKPHKHIEIGHINEYPMGYWKKKGGNKKFLESNKH